MSHPTWMLSLLPKVEAAHCAAHIIGIIEIHRARRLPLSRLHSQAAPLTATLPCSAAPTSLFTASPCGPYKNVFSACSSIVQQHCVADGKFAFNCALESPVSFDIKAVVSHD